MYQELGYTDLFDTSQSTSLCSLITMAVLLESGLGPFSIVSDLSWTRWYLDSDLSRTWSSDSPNVQVGLDRVQQYMLFFLFQNKTINLARLFRKWVM